MFCRNCGKEVNDNAVVCVHCGAATGVPIPNETTNVTLGKDEPETALIVLSFLFTIIGIILAVINYNNGKPNCGKTYLLWAFMPLIVLLIVLLISMVLVPLGT